MADFDELWLRLGLVIHEAPKEALHDVLDNAILSKHTDLAWASFEDKLKVSLIRDEKHLQKFLLAYELPTVFPTSGCPGTYETFDVGIVCKLIQYFVGVAVWDSETASLPCKVMPGSKKPVIDLENLQTSHLITASRLALAKVMGVYRNMVFHHTGSPHLSTDEFNHHWENVMVTLQGLGYDVKKVSVYQSGPLDYKSRLLVGTIKDLFKEALSSIREELASNYDIIDLRQCILNGLKFIGCWVRKLESDMLAELEDLLVKIKALQTNVAGRKEIDDLQEIFEKEIADIDGRMHVMELEISAQKGKMVKVEDKLIDIDKKVDACSLRQEEHVLKIEMGLNDVRQKVDACIRNRNTAKSTLQGKPVTNSMQ